MGGRITVESVVRCLWNGWPDDRGIRKERFFFEVLQRRNGYSGYGAANVAVRLAAMAKARTGTQLPARL